MNAIKLIKMLVLFTSFILLMMLFGLFYKNFLLPQKLLKEAEIVATEQIKSDFGSNFNLVASKYDIIHKHYSVAFLDDSKNHFVNYKVKYYGDDNWFAEWDIDFEGSNPINTIKALYP